MFTQLAPRFCLEPVADGFQRGDTAWAKRQIEGAVVVAGSRQVSHGKGKEMGISLYTPVIVKYRDAKTDEYLSHYRIVNLLAAGSSLKFCLVATGEADLYPRHGRTMEWDTAAGHAVLAAAGGSPCASSRSPW